MLAHSQQGRWATGSCASRAKNGMKLMGEGQPRLAADENFVGNGYEFMA
jgi:hypothetical protein